MALNRGLAAPWWTLRIGSGDGVISGPSGVTNEQGGLRDW
jgi:hypothetical protein